MTAHSLPAAAPETPVSWADAGRAAAFAQWLERVAPVHGLRPHTLRLASADASFRRYFRIDADGDSSPTRIVMDAPPDKEDSRPFVQVARLMREAGVRAPRVLDWDAAQGFLLLDDLGRQTLLDVIDRARPEANLPRYQQAIDALVRWQQASREGVLPPYDAAVLRRELQLFPDWYLARHRGVAVEGSLRDTLATTFDRIVEANLRAPAVFVHRDFMPRNLMVGEDPEPPPGASESRAAGGVGATPPPPGRPKAAGAPPGGSEPRAAGSVGATSPPPGRPKAASAPPGGSEPRVAGSVGATPLGVLDFQDALHGPITYDIASLMRDAFLSWEEPFVIDVTVRYWQAARRAGLPVGEDFGEFYRAVEWMGLQRHLKVAGIFARLTLRDGKPKYLADAPRFIGYIRATAARYRELTPLLRLIDRVEGTEAVDAYSFGRL